MVNCLVMFLLAAHCVYVFVISDLSFNNISTLSKRWLYGLSSLQRLYVIISTVQQRFRAKVSVLSM